MSKKEIFWLLIILTGLAIFIMYPHIVSAYIKVFSWFTALFGFIYMLIWIENEETKQRPNETKREWRKRLLLRELEKKSKDWEQQEEWRREEERRREQEKEAFNRWSGYE